jgi:cysteinyl-tRNA synthetase
MPKKVFKIYNTMSRQLEEFHPLIEEGKKDFVGIYSCGPTVYSEPHIGNMRAYVFADILRNVIKNIL